MSKHYISEIDIKVNKDQTVCFDVAMDRVCKYITSKIDPTFPRKEFEDWYTDGAEKPFRWNKLSFYWSR